jgi:glycerol-3-phosphate dehydrogenase (NAD(P)+)
MVQAMTSPTKRIGVLGAGSWGTALAHHLSGKDSNQVRIWGLESDVLKDIASENKNSKYFPGENLNPNLGVADSLESLVSDIDVLVVSVPSKAYRTVAKQLAPLVSDSLVIVSTAKGLDQDDYKRMTEVLIEEVGNPERIAALSGPSFALEVVKNLPTAVTIASSSEKTLACCVSCFHFGNFRIYSSKDVIGVELGGVIKNVIALAAGLIDGAGMGNNARAALITRGIVEITKIAVAKGAEKNTIYGLSGLGDLVLTATSDLSRNRRVGYRLGKGENLEQIIADLGQVAEAVRSAGFVRRLAQTLQVDVPIIEQVERVVEGQVTVHQAIESLFLREQTCE